MSVSASHYETSYREADYKRTRLPVEQRVQVRGKFYALTSHVCDSCNRGITPGDKYGLARRPGRFTICWWCYL